MMSDFRRERDTLGEVFVPAAALYGAQTQRAIENFPISGLKPWPAFIWSMVLIKRAAAQVNAELGLLKAEYATHIIAAADEVLAGQHHEHFVVDPFQAGAGTSHNMNINEVLANRANQLLGYPLEATDKAIRANDHVNMAQSTNDTIPTAIRLGALWRLDELVAVLTQFASINQRNAIAWDDIVKSGRTHLQDAVPIRLGQEVGAWSRAVERNIAKIQQAADGLKRIGIGGTAAGSGLNAHPRYHSMMVKSLSEASGLELRESDDLFESMQSFADIVFFSGALRATAQDFNRIANDIRLLSAGPTTGIAELTCPPVQPGSSIMPGKVNPVMAEMLNQAMYHCLGNDHTITLCAMAGQLELNVMMPVIAHNLNEMLAIMINAIRAFTERCIDGLTANPERAETWLSRNPILVTALNPLIGYEAGARVAKKALEENKSVREVVLELGLLDEEQLDRALDLRRMTEGGVAESSSNP